MGQLQVGGGLVVFLKSHVMYLKVIAIMTMIV
jgi:hypothetical protein